MTTSWLSPGEPKAAGMSQSRLKLLDAALQDAVDRRAIPGAVGLIVRRGRVAWCGAFGYVDREAGIAMPADAIFRIASMTKPVVSLAAMMLVEEGARPTSTPHNMLPFSIQQKPPNIARSLMPGRRASAARMRSARWGSCGIT
jgi:hypothetical protein